jgi:glycosyltransferase involved in cell wall biosynthesis
VNAAPVPSRRRILHLVGASEDHGGILSVVRGLASGCPDPQWEHLLWMNARFLQTRQPVLPCRYSPTALDESPSHLRLLWAAWKSWPGLRRLVRSEGFHLLHAHSRGSLPLAWFAHRAGLPVLFTNHTYARRRGLYQTAVRQGVPMVLLTPAMARHYHLEPQPGRVELISACVADRFFSSPLPTRATDHRRPLQLTGIGNLVRWKKWELLLEAIRRLTPDQRNRFQLTVWGPVPNDRDARQYHEELRGAARDHGLDRHVRFAGPTQNIPEILARTDWFVLPSTHEPCSVALLEALASGIPGLVSESGGNVDLVREGRTGAWFKPDDAGSLHQRLVEIAEGQLRCDPPEAIRESVRERSAHHVAAQYQTLYGQLLARPDPARRP